MRVAIDAAAMLRTCCLSAAAIRSMCNWDPCSLRQRSSTAPSALKPDAIILGSVSIENNKALIKQAAGQGIVVIGWHATDKPGPVADPPVFTNIGTDPYTIAYTAGEYAVVHSNGAAGAEVTERCTLR